MSNFSRFTICALRAPLALNIPAKAAHFYARCVHGLYRRHATTVHLGTAFGSQMTLKSLDFVQRHIMIHKIWEPAVSFWFHSQLKQGDTFIDVGSNVGYFALLASHRVGNTGKVIAIEPTPPIFDMLKSNCAARPNIDLIKAAASDEVGMIRLFQASNSNSGLSSAINIEESVAHFDVETITLDDLMKNHKEGIAAIKIDVEGAEGKVIAGALETLKKFKPDLIVEINKERFKSLGSSAEQTFAELRSLGYNAYAIQNHYLIKEYIRTTPIPAPIHVDVLSDRQDDLLFTLKTPKEVAACYQGATVGSFLDSLNI